MKEEQRVRVRRNNMHGLGLRKGLGLRLGNTYGLGLEMLFFASQENILFLLAQCLWFSKNLKVFQVSTKIVLEKI